MARSSWLNTESMGHVLAAMMPTNRLVMQVAISTGLRVGDVLALRREQLVKGQRFTVREQKTGKSRRVRLSRPLWEKCLAQSGRVWIFEGRTDWRKHRTRAAVYKDIHRTARLFKSSGVVPRAANIGTHTGRKNWAVERYHQTGDLARVQRELNHQSPAITMLYAMADSIEAGPNRKAQRAATPGAKRKKGRRAACARRPRAGGLE